MLSTVAERMYWFARYLERAENIARLVQVYDNLLLDLPRSIQITWYNLVVLNSATEAFGERYGKQDERSVIRFLLADDNAISIISSLCMVRENVRTTRDVLSAEIWEFVNELYLFAKNNVQQSVARKNRRQFLDGFVKGCQQINGLLSDSISHDAGWQFIRLGRHLERADMTTRILDAGAVLLLEPAAEQGINLPQIVWGHVLRSLGAYQSYRRTVRAKVTGADVARYLIDDAHFPRTIRFCHDRLADAVRQLPNGKAALEGLAQVTSLDYTVASEDDLGPAFRDYLNELQIEFASLHKCFIKTWFSIPQT
ncbi:MAG: alpha-E domain-containing protein [Porticoccaceae bacterium]